MPAGDCPPPGERRGSALTRALLGAPWRPATAAAAAMAGGHLSGRGWCSAAAGAAVPVGRSIAAPPGPAASQEAPEPVRSAWAPLGEKTPPAAPCFDRRAARAASWHSRVLQGLAEGMAQSKEGMREPKEPGFSSPLAAAVARSARRASFLTHAAEAGASSLLRCSYCMLCSSHRAHERVTQQQYKLI